MQVRCERCQTEYELDDARIPEAGVTVKCTVCSQVFKVKEKALLLTEPLQKADTLPVSASHDKAREWKVRQANGNVFALKELTTLQKWIVERKVLRDDEISLTGESWKRLGNIPELASFFQVVEAAERAAIPPSYPSAMGQQIAAQPLVLGSFQGYSATPHPAAVPIPLVVPVAVPQPAVQHKVDPIEVAWPSPQLPADGLDPAEIAAVRRGSGAKWAALIVLLAAIGTGAFYFAKPSSSEPAKPAPVPAPVAAPAVVKPEVEVSPPPAPSPPVETPKPEVKAEPQPAPVPAAAPTARGFDWYIQQGLKRRERGQTEQALNAYEKAAELDPESAEPPTGKGFCLFDLGNYAGAQTAFKEALRKNPRFHDAMLGLAETYKEMHQNKKAIEQYKKYLEEAPEGQEADLARASIERLSQE